MLNVLEYYCIASRPTGISIERRLRRGWLIRGAGQAQSAFYCLCQWATFLILSAAVQKNEDTRIVKLTSLRNSDVLSGNFE
jgi:hypothetical protein